MMIHKRKPQKLTPLEVYKTMGDQQPTRFLSKMCVYILIRFIIRRRCRIVFRRTSFICCPREDMILIVILHHTHTHTIM